jgi:NAD(P)-dependent dehydrogenase (short-subunit alcohol dehydrogenase family)
VAHLANALRLEVAHLGVDVGSAHMSWVDTPMVREQKGERSSFNQRLVALPGPLSRAGSGCSAGFGRWSRPRSPSARTEALQPAAGSP